MLEADRAFKERVYEIVRLIPKGKVMSYGQIAALAGNPLAARIVGGVAHYGDPSLPWQRVVMKDGGLATGYPGGTEGHKTALEAEGIGVDEDYKVDIGRLSWQPEAPGQSSLL